MEREVFDLDVLYVGAGPASLSSALHLHSKLKAEGERNINWYYRKGTRNWCSFSFRCCIRSKVNQRINP